jgi:hypothetical protein
MSRRQSAVLSFKFSAFAARDTVTTQTPVDPKHPPAQHKAPPRVEVYWTAITYKTVVVYVLLFAIIVFAGLYVAVPDFYSKTIKIFNDKMNGDPEAVSAAQTQAKFVNLDGKVQVKKVNSVTWVAADYRTSLDKGDQIQTGSDGAARITFGDGTTYTVKSEALVTVEENLMGANKPTSVAVRINTGSVDLATGNWASPDSKAAVRVEDASADLRQNSRASVKNDPQTNEHEITVSNGSAEVKRGPEKIELTQWEKVSFQPGSAIQKSNVLAPPELVAPLNLAPLITEYPRNYTVHFEWKPAQEAVSYTLRVSATAMFTKMVKEVKVSTPSADLSGFDPGDYFWGVSATDAKKQSSEVSETFKFTLVAQGKSQEMMLQIDGTQLHGRVAEIIGRTEPGAALIINGQSVPNIAADGGFRHFTEQLEPGQHTIVIVGQNRRGGTAKQEVSIVVPK